MKIAIDLDHTITADRNSVEFFRIITHLLIPENEYRVVILTNREPGTEQEVADELDYLGIEYSEIVITSQKAQYIRENKITIFFENEDFYFKELKLNETVVFKIREEGNWEKGRWIGSKKTVKMID
jgi:hypothetical protein